MKKTCIWCAIGFIAGIGFVYYLGRRSRKVTTSDLKSDAAKLEQTSAEKAQQTTPVNPEIKSPIFVDDLKKGAGTLLGSLKKGFQDIVNPGPAQNQIAIVDTQAGVDGYHNATGIETVNLQTACKCTDSRPAYKSGINLNR